MLQFLPKDLHDPRMKQRQMDGQGRIFMDYTYNTSATSSVTASSS